MQNQRPLHDSCESASHFEMHRCSERINVAYVYMSLTAVAHWVMGGHEKRLEFFFWIIPTVHWKLWTRLYLFTSFIHVALGLSVSAAATHISYLTRHCVCLLFCFKLLNNCQCRVRICTNDIGQ